MEKTVVCYLERDSMYLMLHRTKKKNDPNAGKWLGVGGHILEDETPDKALVRETFEETGIVLSSYSKRGIVNFYMDGIQTEKIYVYTASDFNGEITKCDEGDLVWVKKSEIFNLNLWDGDRLFLDTMMKEPVFFEYDFYYANNRLIRSERIR